MSAYGGGERAKPEVFEPEAAIRLGVTPREANETRWGLILVIFMRFLAGLWIIQGLMQWAVFLVPPDALFDRQSTARTAAVIFFSVLDLLAAVGLWLATPWGGVLWLFAAVAQIMVAIMLAHFFAYAWIGVDGVLVAIYFILTWQAGTASR